MKNINLPDAVKCAFADAVKGGFQDLEENQETHDLETTNGAGLYRSNLVYTRIRNNLSHVCQIEYPKRGPWDVCVVYYPETQISATFLSERRYKELFSKQNEKTHYLEALNMINDGNRIQEEQLRFPSLFSERDLESLCNIKKRMYQNIAGEINTHIMIVYGSKTLFEVKTLRAIVATSKFDTVCEEDWSKFLEQEYIRPEIFQKSEENHTNIPIFIQKDMDRNDTLVALKKQKKENKND